MKAANHQAIDGSRMYESRR
ncbi:MAG: hypothetical protein ACYC0F_14315 [Rhodanobacter sp.]